MCVFGGGGGGGGVEWGGVSREELTLVERKGFKNKRSQIA